MKVNEFGVSVLPVDGEITLHSPERAGHPTLHLESASRRC